jgi:hypothetical protein
MCQRRFAHVAVPRPPLVVKAASRRSRADPPGAVRLRVYGSVRPAARSLAKPPPARRGKLQRHPVRPPSAAFACAACVRRPPMRELSLRDGGVAAAPRSRCEAVVLHNGRRRMTSCPRAHAARERRADTHTGTTVPPPLRHAMSGAHNDRGSHGCALTSFTAPTTLLLVRTGRPHRLGGKGARLRARWPRTCAARPRRRGVVGLFRGAFVVVDATKTCSDRPKRFSTVRSWRASGTLGASDVSAGCSRRSRRRAVGCARASAAAGAGRGITQISGCCWRGV